MLDAFLRLHLQTRDFFSVSLIRTWYFNLIKVPWIRSSFLWRVECDLLSILYMCPRRSDLFYVVTIILCKMGNYQREYIFSL